MKNNLKKLAISIIAVAIVIVFLLGFVDKVDKSTEASGKNLVYSIDDFSNDFKKVGNLTKREQDIICASSRGLIEIDSTGKILPSLAESVEVKDDGIEYIFKIRDDIYWSDGSKITPSEIIESFRQAILEEDEDDIIALLNVYGAKNYRENGGAFGKVVAMQDSDDKIVIRLNNKDDNFLTELSKPQYRIRDNILLWDDIKNSFTQLKYSGDYSIESVDENVLTLKKNEHTSKDISDKIVFIKDGSEETAMAAFEVGNRDVVINPPRSQLDRLKSEKRLITMESDRGMYLAYNPNTTITLSGKREIYRKIVKAMEGYRSSNMNLLVMAEGSYFRKDKDELDKLQSRKVSINTEQDWDEEIIIKIIAEENTQNKEVCEFIKTWFENNSKQTIVYDLLNKEEMKNISKEDKYDILLLENYNNPNDDSNVYVKAESYLPKDVLSQINKDNIQAELSRLEETLFDSCIVLPLVFFNDNIAVNNEIQNISLDGNGNIVF